MPASILNPPTGNNPSPPSPMGVTTGANPPVLSGHHPGLCPCPLGHGQGLLCPDPFPCPRPDPKWAADLFVDPCATKPPPVGVVPNSMVTPWFVVKANYGGFGGYGGNYGYGYNYGNQMQTYAQPQVQAAAQVTKEDPQADAEEE